MDPLEFLDKFVVVFGRVVHTFESIVEFRFFEVRVFEFACERRATELHQRVDAEAVRGK